MISIMVDNHQQVDGWLMITTNELSEPTVYDRDADGFVPVLADRVSRRSELTYRALLLRYAGRTRRRFPFSQKTAFAITLVLPDRLSEEDAQAGRGWSARAV